MPAEGENNPSNDSSDWGGDDDEEESWIMRPGGGCRPDGVEVSENLAKLQEAADIDPSGVFKYVLIRCVNGGEEKTLLRGYGWAEYHDDIFQEVAQVLELEGWRCDCVGGGRIQHDPSGKKIVCYGYSQAYGRADHKLSVQLLTPKHPGYDISWSNEGY